MCSYHLKNLDKALCVNLLNRCKQFRTKHRIVHVLLTSQQTINFI